MELLYFGYTRLARAADARLDAEALGRAHQRALYFIARSPGLTVSELLQRLAITKQSLGRVLKELEARGFAEMRQGKSDRRQKMLHLTEVGKTLEADLFADMRQQLSAAYSHAGQEAVTGFWRVLEGLVPQEDRAMVRELGQG